MSTNAHDFIISRLSQWDGARMKLMTLKLDCFNAGYTAVVFNDALSDLVDSGQVEVEGSFAKLA
ncbi:hypothetical protein [Pandoraea commovens]|uniref:Uncharacterized protein n=1 Tax=Pandoraea commovens TaxID=2508289 RepID=A0ABY5QIK9_9BURK|nr:hypothetical protein [Pandoraea commovens]UVA79993.1 hypothetical protein NTU39_02870 [Pandoraea commovens]